MSLPDQEQAVAPRHVPGGRQHDLVDPLRLPQLQIPRRHHTGPPGACGGIQSDHQHTE